MKDEEMAEEYRKAKSECKAKITKVIEAWSAREETIHDVSFKDGAEYGYNKALKEATHNYNAIIADYDKRIAELKSIAQFQTTSNMDRYFQLKRSKEQLEYAKTIIQDLLNNSDEYARQRAMDFLKEE